jgi:hypothetical protein
MYQSQLPGIGNDVSSLLEPHAPNTSLRHAVIVEKLTVQTPQLSKAVSLINGLIERAGVLADPGGLRIIGAPGSGKTVIRDSIIDAYPGHVGPGNQPVVPILSIEMMPAPTISQIVSTMLQALGDSFESSHNATERTDVLKKFIRRTGVAAVLVDEFQHIVEGDRNKSAHTIADWFKRLYDDVQVPFIFLGTPISSKLFEINGQLASRIPGEFELKTLKFDSEFVSVLTSFNQHLPIPIAKEELRSLAKLICKSSEGSMRILKKLLKEAVVAASEMNVSFLSQCHFQTAYDRVICSGKNPFEDLA